MTGTAGRGLLPTASARPPGRVREVAVLFLRLGLTAFGGPAAHIAMMEDEAVVRRRWLTRERFLDRLGIANLLPGPSSSEMAIYLGYLRAGWAGLVLGGTCFIGPAAVLVGAIAWSYARFGSLPQMAGALYGIRPVVVAIILQAVWRDTIWRGLLPPDGGPSGREADTRRPCDSEIWSRVVDRTERRLFP